MNTPQITRVVLSISQIEVHQTELQKTAKKQNMSNQSTYAPVFDAIRTKFNSNEQQVIKEDVESVAKPNKPCFILKNVLSREECQHLIVASEQRGYEDAESYSFLYRDRYNDRLMSDDTSFSQLVWDRVRHLLPQTMPAKGRTSAVKEYRLHSLNCRWRYCRYLKGHYFGGHCDGKYAKDRLESMLTFMLYLNGPKTDELVDGEVHFEGGSTNFLDLETGKLVSEIVPEPGLALVFLQEDPDLYHEGAMLKDGIKYILRSDVMYERRY